MIQSSATFAPNNNDRLRQILNVVAAFGQLAATGLVYLIGSNSSFDNSTSTPESLIVPADYAFIIWSVVYLGGLAYAIYQALPAQRENELLRRIGFYTAAAYFGVSLWLVTASLRLVWPTVAVFFLLIGVPLLLAFIQLIRYHAPRSMAENFLVVLPISVFFGWTTAAVIVNVSTALKDTGFDNVLFSDQTWAIVMLIIGTLIGAFVTWVSRGNYWYGLAIVWALVGIVVANLTRTTNVPVVLTAAVGAVVVGLVLLVAWLSNRRQAAITMG